MPCTWPPTVGRDAAGASVGRQFSPTATRERNGLVSTLIFPTALVIVVACQIAARKFHPRRHSGRQYAKKIAIARL
jgi:hypothetical protein